MNYQTIFFALCLLGMSEAAMGEGQVGPAAPETHPVMARAIAEHASVQPGGTTRIGVLFELEKGWHIYAANPGDAGLPTKVTWSVPEGVSLGLMTWPASKEFIDPGDVHTFGYTGSALLTNVLTAPANAPATLPLHAKVTWLACKEICLPGSAILDLVLPVRTDTPQSSPDAARFSPAL